jgi:ABC-type uncharacterized transport system ATPase subunit
MTQVSLDPNAYQILKDIIADLKEQGVTADMSDAVRELRRQAK